MSTTHMGEQTALVQVADAILTLAQQDVERLV